MNPLTEPDKNPFDYQKPSEENAIKIEALRQAYKALHRQLLDLKPSRFMSLAITNLEQSAMWAIKSIVFEEQ